MGLNNHVLMILFTKRIYIMKPINFVGPVQLTTPYEFSKRAYGFEEDMKGNRYLELQVLKGLTLPPKKILGIRNSYVNIAGQ